MMFVEGDRVWIEPPQGVAIGRRGTVAGMIGRSVVVVVLDNAMGFDDSANEVALVYVGRCEYETP